MRRWSVLVLGLVFATAFCALLQAAEPVAKSWAAGQATAAAAPSRGTAAVPATAGVSEKRLGLLERRKLGLTIGQLRPVVKQMIDEGRLDPENHSAAAAAVMDELASKNPSAWQDPMGAPDWDAILEFLEKLMPLILKLIALFG